MLHTPQTLDEAAQCVRECSRLQIVGASTKSALTQPIDELDRLSTAALAGIVDYQPGEFLITALAGTTLRELDETLATQGQYLPFDPPCSEHGATIGGTVAANLSGSGRLKYGGLRDFLMGVRVIDGLGNIATGGGRVVKNAAGYDLPKLVAGCCGSLALIVEVTLKVFPRATHELTLVRMTTGLEEAMGTCQQLSVSPLEITALDISQAGLIEVLLTGTEASTIASRDRLLAMTDSSWQTVDNDRWHHRRQWNDVDAGERLVRVPLAPSQLTALDASLNELRVPRRYGAAGNVAWIRWPASQPIRTLDETLLHHRLGGTLLTGTAARCRLGRRPSPELMRRLQQAMDPHKRFVGAG